MVILDCDGSQRRQFHDVAPAEFSCADFAESTSWLQNGFYLSRDLRRDSQVRTDSFAVIIRSQDRHAM